MPTPRNAFRFARHVAFELVAALYMQGVYTVFELSARADAKAAQKWNDRPEERSNLAQLHFQQEWERW